MLPAASSAVEFVEVGAGGEAVVGVAEPGWLRDPVAGGGSEGAGGAAVEVVAADADVVCGCGPAEVDVAAGDGRGECAGRAGCCCVGDRRRCFVRGRADVAGRVLGGDLVEVAAGREPCVGVASAGRLRDPVAERRREAAGGAAMEVVAEDSDVVCGGRPAEVDGAAGDRAGEPGRRAWRVGVCGHGRRRLVRGRTDVAGRVLGGDLVEVAAGAGEVRVAGARRLRDPVTDRGGEAGAGAAVDVVAHHTDVVCRRTPGQRCPAD